MRHLLIYDDVLREAAAEGLITVESLMPKAERLALMFGDQEVYSEWVVFPSYVNDTSEFLEDWISFWKRSVIDKFFTVEIL